jgi:hypothetical protein
MIDQATRRRLLAIVRMLDSDKDGERLAALDAVRRLLPNGATIADVFERGLEQARAKVVVPDWRIVRSAQMGPVQ